MFGYDKVSNHLEFVRGGSEEFVDSTHQLFEGSVLLSPGRCLRWLCDHSTKPSLAQYGLGLLFAF